LATLMFLKECIMDLDFCHRQLKYKELKRRGQRTSLTRIKNVSEGYQIGRNKKPFEREGLWPFYILYLCAVVPAVLPRGVTGQPRQPLRFPSF
jgi:hypothetical protein